MPFQTEAGSPQPIPLQCTAESPHLPQTINVADYLRATIETMLQASPTFRAQCRRLAAVAHVRIKIWRSAWLFERSIRARSSIRRANSGIILVMVELMPLGSVEEWIAHEFEHVLEQLDGVRVRELAETRGEAWRTADDVFETERAIRAGHAVARELRRARDRPQDKLVE